MQREERQMMERAEGRERAQMMTRNEEINKVEKGKVVGECL